MLPRPGRRRAGRRRAAPGTGRPGAHLAVGNRFGALEATGGGHAAELAALVGEDIPVLTVVAAKHLDAWRRFTGGMGEELPPRMAALRSWFTLAVGRRVPA